MNKQIFELRAEICKAMAHPLRMEVLDILAGGDHSFGEIHAVTGGLKSNLSQHLSIMTSKGILKTRKEGQITYYKLVSKRVTEACKLINDLLVEQLKDEQKILNELI